MGQPSMPPPSWTVTRLRPRQGRPVRRTPAAPQGPPGRRAPRCNSLAPRCSRLPCSSWRRPRRRTRRKPCGCRPWPLASKHRAPGCPRSLRACPSWPRRRAAAVSLGWPCLRPPSRRWLQAPTPAPQALPRADLREAGATGAAARGAAGAAGSSRHRGRLTPMRGTFLEPATETCSGRRSPCPLLPGPTRSWVAACSPRACRTEAALTGATSGKWRRARSPTPAWWAASPRRTTSRRESLCRSTR
mmetsp:Transcript_35960/g.103370  ORF Transcript_35960/g.103370 Transcript_35960/m.103370 type:complete len:245 (+) Transcript_35960:400-1134(+)